ncbi:MAG: SpoIIIAH-like family protein [Clostridia bacterium]|nr:SpoIIIAH-like family protein [Clostridia bacterium]
MEIRSLCISPKHISNKLSTTFKKTKEKMKSKKFWKLDKKKVMAASAVLLIGAAVYLNYVFFLEDTKDTMTQNDIVYENSLATNSNTDPSNEVNYFTQAVMDRQKARDEALEVLQIVVENEDALASSKDSALQQMSKIAEDMQKESNIESLVVSKGFEECVAVISEGKCNVIVKTEGLQANEISQIKEIVYEQAAINPLNIKIIEKN